MRKLFFTNITGYVFIFLIINPIVFIFLTFVRSNQGLLHIFMITNGLSFVLLFASIIFLSKGLFFLYLMSDGFLIKRYAIFGCYELLIPYGSEIIINTNITVSDFESYLTKYVNSFLDKKIFISSVYYKNSLMFDTNIVHNPSTFFGILSALKINYKCRFIFKEINVGDNVGN